MTGEMRVRELPRTVSSPFSTNSGGALRKRGVTVRTATRRAAAAPAKAHWRAVKNAKALSYQAALPRLDGRALLGDENGPVALQDADDLLALSASFAKQEAQLK